MKERVRIGGGGGFWGDSARGPEQLIKHGAIDYLVLDYLAELTLSIMAKQRQRNDKAGYATDFVVDVMAPLMMEIKRKGIRVVANAGGMNAQACAAAVRHLAMEKGIELKIGVVEGDDLICQPELLKGANEMYTGLPLPDQITSANAYLGAFPIAAALARGADVVITGRCVDSALALGVLIHEFNWKEHDFDQLAAGSVVGHILECGTQTTGGLYTDWRLIPGREDVGYPIADVSPDGSFVLTKPEGTGGLVTPLIVAEQMLYEVQDPGNYLLPDVTCDIRDVRLRQVGPNQVSVSGAKGTAPGDCYKTSITYEDGYRASATLTIVGRDAVERAEHIGHALLERTRQIFRERNLGDYEETHIDLLGSERSLYGATAQAAIQKTREIVLRIAVRHKDEAAVNIFGREIAPFGTSGTPGTTGFSGRQKAQKVYRLFSTLLSKDRLSVTVDVDGERQNFAPAMFSQRPTASARAETRITHYRGPTVRMPLSSVAVARSGDKGDTCCLAVIARCPDFFPILLEQVTPQRVADHLAHLVAGPIERYEVPGTSALNFMLFQALGGGGAGSLRNDPLGKAFAQILLDLEIDVPAALSKRPEIAA
ncbi:acyclic terpene utilization AtuA family protein [Bradyrhizobium sp. LHD-71]|uniref:acyclic terpene utilization AtuA family protein n=1 Tax=Bradyrhizobium sp. LHD-71 TaxID=3072141 RepID=UPI0028109359|nr:acyclic terpene utilization AtuA family protein [Bradyrhizobium sp. LHD-71]MDQ8728236.1 acyclic terpene utilization AtuA family protein [Bradyrhizobium sp. LHD-71]